MSKIFNRAPTMLNTPKASDVQNNYITHCNWKGLTNDKNFLEVDQDTFANCKNVYVDSEGLLKSRPSLKHKILTYVLEGTTKTLSDVIDLWSFNKVKIYQSKLDDKFYLTFINEDFVNDVKQFEIFEAESVKMFQQNEQIFIFTEYSIYLYDIKTNEINEAAEYVYIPITKIIVDGVETAASDYESLNELTSSYYVRYIYTQLDKLNIVKFIGQEATVKLGDEEFKITFTTDTLKTFVVKINSLSSDNYSDEYLYGNKDAFNIPLISVSEKGNMILSSYDVVEDSIINNVEYTANYSSDGVVFTVLPYLDDVIRPFKITQDGYHAIAFCKNGLYIYSVLATDEGSYKYNYWTDLFKYLNESYYCPWNVNFSGLCYNIDTYINGDFWSDEDFVVTYGINPVVKFGDPLYASLNIVKCESKIISYSKLYGNDSVITSDTNNAIKTRVASYPRAVEYSDIVRSFEYRIYSNNVSGTGTVSYLDGDDVLYTIDYNPEIKTKYSTDNNIITFEIEASGEFKITNYDGIVLYSENVILHDAKEISLEDATKDITGTLIDSNGLSVWYNCNSYFDEYGNFKTSYSTLRSTIYVQLYNSGNIASTKLGIVTKNTPNVKVKRINDKLMYVVSFVVCNFENKKYEKVYKYGYDVSDNFRTTDFMTNDDIITSIPLRDSYLLTSKHVVIAGNEYSDKLKTRVCKILSYVVVKNNPLVYNYTYELMLENDLYDKLQTVYLSDNAYLFTTHHMVQLQIKNDYYVPSETLKLLHPSYTLYYSNKYLYLISNNSLYSSNVNNVEITIDVFNKGTNSFFKPDMLLSSEHLYVSKNNTLYINEFVNSEGFKLYFPKINTQKFNNPITNLHAISSTETAIFFDDEVYYVTNSDKGYMYYKSNVQVGCMRGSDIITTFDGKYTIFASKRGIVAMSYQQFVASTEQALTYLTDNIYDIYFKFYDGPVKMYKYGFWIVCYKQKSADILLFDTRNSSWWFMSGNMFVKKLIDYNDEVEILLNNDLYRCDTSENEYYDFDGKEKHTIEWFIESQKLHFGSINYHKNIRDISVISVLDNYKNLSFNLQITNYRKTVSEQNEETLQFKVDSIRTFVKHLNCFKVNQLKYILRYDDELYEQVPLSLTSITIKYKITRQVR